MWYSYLNSHNCLNWLCCKKAFPQKRLGKKAIYAKGDVHKLGLQDEVGKWSKNVNFLSMFENVDAGGLVIKNIQNHENVVCEQCKSW